MANTCLTEAGKVDTATLAGKLGIVQAALAQLLAQMEAVRTAQDKLTSLSRALLQMMAALALAQAMDTKQKQQPLTLQIQTLTGELKELQTRWQILTANTGGVAVAVAPDHSGEKIPAMPLQLPQENSSGGSRWQTISFTSDTTSQTNIANAHGEATSKQWSCNLWLASGSGSSSSSSGVSVTASMATGDTIVRRFFVLLLLEKQLKQLVFGIS
ncbi:hypothetical protein B0H14DRAFT_3451307 [Mycena olivaceomarginata]|nr:hypothetical protein B0H14DRAFT_3451307 [Mycena olivaceomarginata]